MRTARRVVLSVVGLFLLAFPANAQLCVNCDTGGAGCIVTVGQPGFWECTNMGGGSCLLEEPGCGPITLLRELGSDGLRVPVLAEVGEAALAWGEMTFDGDLPAGLTASLAADGREVLRDCSGAIVGRRSSVVIATVILPAASSSSDTEIPYKLGPRHRGVGAAVSWLSRGLEAR